MTREIKFGNRTIGLNHPTYFIDDIAANHDGDMERAKLLIRLAKEAGADAAKFQNFDAPKIVSDYGFKAMSGGQVSHQAAWKKSVFEVYKGASIPFDWSMTLVEECNEVGIDYFSSPYDFEAIDFLVPYSPAIKIGSGEGTWHEAIERIALKGLPVLMATGAGAVLITTDGRIEAEYAAEPARGWSRLTLALDAAAAGPGKFAAEEIRREGPPCRSWNIPTPRPSWPRKHRPSGLVRYRPAM